MLTSAFLAAFGRELPLDRAMRDDPVGLQAMADDRELATVAVAYEANERVVEKAAELGAELLVVFHPLIYPAVRRITPATRVERTLIALLQRRVALFVVHTAFDAHPEGTSALLARRLGLANVRPLAPNDSDPSAGMGALGELPQPVGLDELARLLRTATGAPAVRVSHDPGETSGERTIGTVAILGGSGMSFYDQAARAGADALITADVRYHGFHEANDRIPVLDPGHAESETFVAAGMATLVERAIAATDPSIRCIVIDEPTNPVRFVV